jgi:hypothetical protein
VAEKERLTNKERRQLAREERKRKAEEAAKAAQRRRIVSGISTVLVIAVIAAVVWAAVLGGDDISEAIVLNASEVEDARAAAGCEIVADQPVPPPYGHLPLNGAPPADQVYSDPRPVNSGPHIEQTLPVIRGGSNDQMSELQSTHNLEHGAIIAWYDPEQLDGGAVGELEDWSSRLIESGFSEPRAGTGIFVSPYTDPGISSGRAIAFRAWGYSLDCDTWDEEVANSFVLERYGTHGAAPEGNFARFPEDLMRWDDEGGPAGGDAPTDGGHGATEAATPSPTPDATDPATEEPTAEEPTAEEPTAEATATE